MRRRRLRWAAISIIAAALVAASVCAQHSIRGAQGAPKVNVIKLPAPTLDGPVSLEAAIAKRRSVREFRPAPLTMAHIGQLAWAAQGITDPANKYRAAPSAGATYPLELYFVTPRGLLHYIPDGHRMERLSDADFRPQLREAGLGQKSIAEAPLVIVMAAVYERTAARFRERATRYVHIEAGHVGQNIQLQAVALGLVSVPIGGRADGRACRALGLPEDQQVVYAVCVGQPQSR